MNLPIARVWMTLTGAALPLLMALAVPRAVKAECGDYVHMGKQAARPTPPDAPAIPEPPCHGPNCSQRLPMTPAPAPAPAPVPADEWLCSLPRPQVDGDAPASRVPLSEPRPVSCNPADIFHPPR